MQFGPPLLNNIFQNTILKLVFEYFYNQADLYTTHLKIFSKLTDYAKSSNEHPGFLYAHVLAPHSPFVIDAEGQSIEFINQKSKQDNSACVNQVKGLNKLVLKTVQEIVSRSPDAIIVIQGDHGSRFITGNNFEKKARTIFLAYLIHGNSDTTSVMNSHAIFERVFKNL